MRSILASIFTLFSVSLCLGQSPKLVVGIVVDQFRYDYLIRFKDDFGKGGFNRMTNEGFVFRNAHYNYTPTKTGPGHASIYSGTTPSRHGIIGNSWYLRDEKTNLNCVEDKDFEAVGADPDNGRVSPKNLLTTNIADELRLFHTMQSKVIGVSVKDRGACLPAGHNPTGAYWLDNSSGNMITSTYYQESLPEWVVKFNNRNLTKKYLRETWDYFKAPENYAETFEDQNDFEQEIWKGSGNTFPYDFSKSSGASLKYSPFSIPYLIEFSQAAILAEGLGQDDITDLLALSISTTDDLGHRYGPRAKEIQDTYLRLDAELARFFTFLDANVGEGNYTVFLTADHGASDISAFLVSNKMPGGYMNNAYLKGKLNNALAGHFKVKNLVSSIVNDQVYLDQASLIENNIDLDEAQKLVMETLTEEDYITEAFTATQLAKRNMTDPIAYLFQNGYNNDRSGDVAYVVASGYLNDSYGRKGTDHRSPYTYDTHVPILFYGWGIRPGNSVRRVSITDIAPTMSTLINITLPSGATGNPLTELFD